MNISQATLSLGSAGASKAWTLPEGKAGSNWPAAGAHSSQEGEVWAGSDLHDVNTAPPC